MATETDKNGTTPRDRLPTNIPVEKRMPQVSRNQKASSRISVGVLVLNYNTWELALRALNAAIALESEEINEYVLFDDGSPTPPPSGMDTRIRVVSGSVNRGFAAALNVAFTAMNSDVVVLFDSDAYPLTKFASRVREYFTSDSRLGQLGFSSEDENGSPTESFLTEPTKWSLLLGQRAYARLQKAPHASTLCIVTGCMATARKAYFDIGGFDERLEFLDVDVDYSMRLRRNGWRVEVDNSIRTFHVGGGTPQGGDKRLLRFYKSRWYLLRKHALIKNARLARTFILARLLLEWVALRVFGKMMFRTDEALAHKVAGRRELIAFCREHYS